LPIFGSVIFGFNVYFIVSDVDRTKVYVQNCRNYFVNSQYSPQEAGQLTGALIGVLALVFGAFNLFQKRTRPDLNLKCLWSLILILLALASLRVVQFLTPGNAQQKALGSLVVAAIVTLIGVILAIQGLFEIRTDTARTQGKKFAIWALSLGIGLIFLPATFGVLRGIHDRTAAQNLLVSASPAKAGTPLAFTNLNFSFIAPPGPWTQINAKKISPFTSVAFMRSRPDLFCFIIAEALNESFTADAIIEMAQGQIRSAMESPSFTRPSPREANGLRGTAFESAGTLSGKRLFGVHWCAETNGYVYQLIVRGLDADRDSIRTEAKALTENFHLLDPSRHASEQNVVTAYSSIPFAYSIDLSGSRWSKWPSLNSDFDGADFGATRDRMAFFGIVPFYLHGEELPLDVFLRACASHLKLTIPENSPNIRKSADTISFEGERELDQKPYTFEVSAIVKNGYGYLLAGWWPKGNPSFGKDVRNAITQFHPQESSIALSTNSLGIKGFNFRFEDLPEDKCDSLGLLYNEIGIIYYRDHLLTNSLSWFQRAMNYKPGSSIILMNVLLAYKDLNQPSEALKYLEGITPDLRNREATHVSHAGFLAEAGKMEEAIDEYSKVFSLGYVDDDSFENYLSLLSEAGQFKEAISDAENYLKKRDSTAIKVSLASLFELNNEPKKAVDLLKPAQAKSLFNSQLAFATVRAHLAAEQYSEARALLEEISRRGFAGAYSETLMGKALLGLKLYKESLARFEAASKLDFKNKEVQSYIDYVSALLGQGQNYSIKTPIDPILPPEKVLADLDETKALAAGKDYGAYYQEYIIGTEFHKGQPRTTTYRYKAHILNETGVSVLSAFQFPFDPIKEIVFVNELKVYSADGKLLATGSNDQFYVIDSPSQSASYEKLLNIPIPALSPGATLDMTISSREISGREEFPFTSFTLSRYIPVARTTIWIAGDTEHINWDRSSEVAFEAVGSNLCFRAENPRSPRWESLGDLATFLPTLTLGTTKSNWNSEVSSYVSRIKERLKSDPKVAAFAKSNLGSAKNDLEKIRNLSRAIQKRIRYKALEFGVRGTIPNTAAQTLDQGFGDCKDSAVLLSEALDAAGIPSKLALIRPQSKIFHQFPSLDQFSHMIVYVPGQKLFLDCTDKYLDLVSFPPSSLIGSESLILDEQEPLFLTVQPPDSEANSITSERQVNLRKSNTLEIKEVLHLNGYTAAGIRSMLAELPLEDRKATIVRVLSRHVQNLELTECSYENFDDPLKPLVLKSTYQMKKRVRDEARFATVHFPSFWENVLLDFDRISQRKTPFKVHFRTELRSHSTFIMPSEWSLDSSLSKEAATGAFASFESNPTYNKQVINLETSAHLHSGEFPPEKYSDYQREMEEAARQFEPEIQFTRQSNL
jgi:tetratricopeptide (TPR) repeat protein